MSLRQIASQLGITPAYLSYMVNGKRPWRPDLYERYCQIVNTFVNSVNKESGSQGGEAPHNLALELVGRVGIEPTTPGLKVAQAVSSSAYNVNNTDLIGSFIQDRQAGGLSPNTIRFYREKLTYIADNLANGKPILSLTKQNVQQILVSLPCNPGGRHAYLRALRAFYSWAEDTELVANNPCSKIRIKVPKPLRHVVKVGDIPQLLAACETVRDKLVVSMLADTGLRQSELANIKLENIDLDTCTIEAWGKGAKQRVVRYGPQTATLLAQYLSQPVAEDTLFGLKPRGIAITLYRLGKTTGIRCNAHAFRRTFACESVRNGLNVFYVQSLLGHSSLTMTRIYAEQVNSEDAIKAYKAIVT